MKIPWRTMLALFVAAAFVNGAAGRPQVGAAREIDDDAAQSGGIFDDEFVYDVTARFNEVLIANIDAADSALMAIFAGTVAVAVFAIDKTGELAPGSERIALALLATSALSCLVAYTISFPLRAFSNRDGVRPERFIPDFVDEPQAATVRAIDELTRAGEVNLTVRRTKKLMAVLAVLLVLAGATVVAVARLHGKVVSYPA